MVKPNKKVFYVLISLTITFLAAMLIFLFVPEPQPITVTEKFYISETQNGFELHGKIQNDSGQDRTFNSYGQQITVSLRIKDPITGKEYDEEYKIFDREVTVQAGGSYEIIKDLDIRGQAKITKITAQLSKDNYYVGYTLYGKIVNDGTFAVIAAFAGIAGFTLLIGAVANLTANIKSAKRANRIIDNISKKSDGAVYAYGYYGNKNQERTNAAKSAIGIIGGASMQLLTGAGVYKTNAGRRRRDFVICPDALFEIVGKEQKYYDILPQVKEIFENAEIVEKRNTLTMTGADGESYFTLVVNDCEKQKLKETLDNLLRNNK